MNGENLPPLSYDDLILLNMTLGFDPEQFGLVGGLLGNPMHNPGTMQSMPNNSMPLMSVSRDFEMFRDIQDPMEDVFYDSQGKNNSGSNDSNSNMESSSSLVSNNANSNNNNNKRRKVAESAKPLTLSSDTRMMMREDAYKMYKTLFAKDIRRAYPRLIQDAINTSNFNHLQRVIHLVCDPNGTIASGKLINQYNQHTFTRIENELMGVGSIYECFMVLCEKIPDMIFEMDEFKVKMLTHVPKSFEGIPLSIMLDENTTILDNILMDIAMTKEYTQPIPGYCMVGKYRFSGTLFNFNLSLQTTNAPEFFINNLISTSMLLSNSMKFSNNTNVFNQSIHHTGEFIWVFNANNKVLRWELYNEVATI